MMPLFDLPHTRARALLAGGAPVYLFVNPVEYHGPHLSLHNDALISLGLARDIHAGLASKTDWPLVLTSDLEVGVDPCCGPGTRATPFRTVRRLVVEACARLAELGAQRVVLMTFHGAPLHSLAVDAGVRWLAARGIPALSPLHALLRVLLTIRPQDYADAYATIVNEDDRTAALSEGPTDFHAGFFETSLSLHYAPESVHDAYRELPPCPVVVPDRTLMAAARVAHWAHRAELASELRFLAAGAGWYALRPFPGYTSRPACASRESGAIIAHHVVREFTALCERVLEGHEKAPEPVLQWMTLATGGGRVKTGEVPVNEVASFPHLEVAKVAAASPLRPIAS